MDQPNPSQTPPNNCNKKILIFLTLLAIITTAGFFYLNSIYNKCSPLTFQAKELANPSYPQDQTPNQNIEIPKSIQKGFPIIDRKTHHLYVYSFLSNKILDTNTIVLEYGGASGLGENKPLPSPNLLYTAYIDNNNNLWLLSNETLEKTQITKNRKASYISGWSPDSQKLVYWTANDKDIKSVKEAGMGPAVWEGTVKFNKNNYPSGFNLLDLENKTNQILYPLTSFESFVGNDKILATGGEKNDKLIVFNFNTYEADYSIKDNFGFGANQFNISKDGSTWTYTLSRNPTQDANIILAPFPQKEGTQIDTGAWANVQFPKLSPDSNKVAYIKSEGHIKPGVPKNVVWIYDSKTNNKSGYIQGMPETWIDENSLVISDTDFDSNTTSYYILNLQTKNSTKIY